MFFDNVFQFAHLFSAEFVHSFWHSLRSFARWGHNEFLGGESRPIRDWRERVIPLSQDIFSKNGNENR